MENWQRIEKELLREKAQGNKESIKEKRNELVKALEQKGGIILPPGCLLG